MSSTPIPQKEHHLFPLIAGIIGFVADIIGIGTFVTEHQSQAPAVGNMIPIMVLIIAGYSWFILAWILARVAIVREINDSKKRVVIPMKRANYRVASTLGVGILATPIVLITAYRIDPHVGVKAGSACLAITAALIFLTLAFLMPLMHDESAYR